MTGRETVFICRACGQCCLGRGGVRLDAEEAGRAARFLGLGAAAFRRLYLDKTGPPWDILSGPDNFCLFHQADGRCLIHPVKPAVCRAWPFLPGLLAHPSAFEEAKSACPGLSRQADWAAFRKAGQDQLEEPGTN